jgi:hypothetical protein
VTQLSKHLAVLKLDIDRQRRPSLAHMAQLLNRAGYGLLDYEIHRSPGGRGWHCYLWVDPLPRTPMEVIALQAVLGSDPQREACNLLRARKMWRTPGFARSWFNVLYRS